MLLGFTLFRLSFHDPVAKGLVSRLVAKLHYLIVQEVNSKSVSNLSWGPKFFKRDGTCVSGHGEVKARGVPGSERKVVIFLTRVFLVI